MLKIEFNEPKIFQIGTYKKKVGKEMVNMPKYVRVSELMAKKIWHEYAIMYIELPNGFIWGECCYDTQMIKSILPFNENQTKQFKIV